MLTAIGKLYLASIVGLYARCVVGWPREPSVNDQHLSIAPSRSPQPSAGLLYHLDQGSTYASADYQGGAA